MHNYYNFYNRLLQVVSINKKYIYVLSVLSCICTDYGTSSAVLVKSVSVP